MNNSINLCDIRHWWEASGGDMKAGHFNVQLYLDYLERRQL